MPTVADLVVTLEAIAPPHLAEPWDNIGLLLGGREWSAKRVFLTIDLTGPVFDEAASRGAELVIAYHPPIFDALKSITDADANTGIILQAAAAHIAVYSPHTALDAAEGGINDWLAAGLGSGDIRALAPHEHRSDSEENKVVTFCPADVVETLRNALSAIGAGRIGNYEQCSFELVGTGTFLGGEASNPTTGKAGQLERVDEVRLEMVCPTRSLALAVASIRNLHPYEEPPIEVYPLRARPQRQLGAGRRIVLDQPVTLEKLVARIKRSLGRDRVVAAVGEGSPEEYCTVGVCAGAGGALLDSAIADGCEVYFTGEMRHHDILKAQARGCTVILAGHTNTERGYLPVLASRIREARNDIEVMISEVDNDPLVRM